MSSLSISCDLIATSMLSRMPSARVMTFMRGVGLLVFAPCRCGARALRLPARESLVDDRDRRAADLALLGNDLGDLAARVDCVAQQSSSISRS
ncbi:MAG TPA: hypothetical protein VMJ10_23295 [Kofleriaceae bacterium]|nr:hypothetical protein [Kofleriaceae bacterium]